MSFNFVKVKNFLDLLNYICPENTSVNSSPFIKKSISIQKEVFSHFKKVAKEYNGKGQHSEYLDALLSKYYQIKTNKFYIQSKPNKYTSFYFLNDITFKELIEKQTINNELFIESLKTLKKEKKKNNTMIIFMQIMESFRFAQYHDKYINDNVYIKSDIFKIDRHDKEIKLIKNILFLRDKLKKSKIKHNSIASYKRECNKILKSKYNNSIENYIKHEIKPYFSPIKSHSLRDRIAIINFKYRLSSNHQEWQEFSNKINYLQKNNLIWKEKNGKIHIYDENDKKFLIL